MDRHFSGTRVFRPGSRPQGRATRVMLDPRAIGGAGEGSFDITSVTGFAFRATDYYADLINPDDAHDPIRRLIVPSASEVETFGDADASNEAANTVVPGLQHKYPDTALLLVTDQCAGFCRYCFRKRLFSGQRRETLRDLGPALDYIAAHTEITDVLLSGGDPLTLPTERLRDIVTRLLGMTHVRTIRIGSKVPAFNPSRIYSDVQLARLVGEITESGRTFYLMTHFDHPREITNRAHRALAFLQGAGGVCLNQCPVTRGINDDPEVLARLFQRCTDVGAPQYYVFQCRPARGNSGFVVPITEVMGLVEAARDRVSGLSRRARYCMSCAEGKIEFAGVDDRHIYARFHRAKDPANAGRFMVFRRDDTAAWYDELVPVAG